MNEEKIVIEGVSCMALSPDGKHVVVAFSTCAEFMVAGHVKTKSLFSILTTDGLKEVA